jgi:adenosine deaminase
VVAVNLVQPEDSAPALRDFALQMKMLDYLHGVYPQVHISLHAGELAPGLVPPEALRSHIRASVDQGHAERIGHGVDVMYEDRPAELLQELAAKGVLVEICLSSNDQILGVRGRYHPLRELLRAGVPVALATDDPGVARSEITFEYLRAVQEHGLGYVTLKAMARASIQHAFADAPTRARLLADLDTAFAAFEKTH